MPHEVSNLPQMWKERPHQSCLLLSWEGAEFREAIQGSRRPVNTSKVQMQWTSLHVKVLSSSLQDFRSLEMHDKDTIPLQPEHVVGISERLIDSIVQYAPQQLISICAQFREMNQTF